MKTVVIHHSADFDGLFCREIARKFLPDAELIGWDFGDQPIAHPEGQRYVIMDLPVDRVFGIKFTNGYAEYPDGKGQPLDRVDWSNVTWIDHHRSAIESHPKEIPGYRIEGVAACRLAWQWFIVEKAKAENPNSSLAIGVPGTNADYYHREVSEPLAVRLAGEYDVFDKRDPDAELFQHALRSREITPHLWQGLLDTTPNDLLQVQESQIAVSALMECGRAIQFSRDQEYAAVIKQQGFTCQWEGVNFLMCNSHELDIRSQLFEAGIKPEHDALLGFTYNGRDWRVSMYHILGKEQVDILGIAKKHGGGGHSGACGCRLKQLPWL